MDRQREATCAFVCARREALLSRRMLSETFGAWRQRRCLSRTGRVLQQRLRLRHAEAVFAEWSTVVRHGRACAQLLKRHGSERALQRLRASFQRWKSVTVGLVAVMERVGARLQKQALEGWKRSHLISRHSVSSGRAAQAHWNQRARVLGNFTRRIASSAIRRVWGAWHAG